MARCYNPKSQAFQNYGGRGIRVCEAWHNAETFCKSAITSGYQADMSIERVSNDGWYAPSNCVWATRTTQARNRRTSRLITYQGRTQTLAAWSEELGIAYATLHRRLERCEPERAFQNVLPKLENLITINDEAHTLTNWAKLTGIHYSTVCHRIAEGWPIEKALTEPNRTGWRKGQRKAAS